MTIQRESFVAVKQINNKGTDLTKTAIKQHFQKSTEKTTFN